ncbi:hypothetical protein BCF33_1018 [Hasllibacter halocynthiae]|uniref:Chitin binding peritrophin-A-like protein n=1 Tax=Hasllibacter halocynthiae TaxID=595589 RepID=A0A2T0X900_9RHOB|nr:adenylosuccinate lyase [Hasllibacter halocynthiae]PRY95399.1 hypothetical protein BCF33_1018 [Hasllibacter halocynthiae]
MTTRLTAFLLSLLVAGPVLAAGCDHGATEANVSCAPGTAFDAASGTCVEELTG